jgi:hypothetical protein
MKGKLGRKETSSAYPVWVKAGGGPVVHRATYTERQCPRILARENVPTKESSPKVFTKLNTERTRKAKNGEQKIALCSKTIRRSSTMVAATETGKGDMTAIVGGMYDEQFGRVRGYTKHSVKLMLVQGLARRWAKKTANVKVTVRKTSARVLNLNEVERVATWDARVMEKKKGALG